MILISSIQFLIYPLPTAWQDGRFPCYILYICRFVFCHKTQIQIQIQIQIQMPTGCPCQVCWRQGGRFSCCILYICSVGSCQNTIIKTNINSDTNTNTNANRLPLPGVLEARFIRTGWRRNIIRCDKVISELDILSFN